MNIVALTVPPTTAEILKIKEFRKFFKIWLLLELPWRSFIGLEPACIATTGNGVAGDLYNSVQSG